MKALRPVLVLPLLAAALAAQAVVYDFETVPLGTSVPFGQAADGVAARFSSRSAGDYSVTDGAFFGFVGLSGHCLLGGGNVDVPLTVAFDAPLSAFSTRFATPSGVPLTLTAFRSADPVGTATATGAVPAGARFFEGTVGLSGVAFDRVVLSADAGLAVDDVSATATATPEPSALAALSLGAVAFVRRRKRA